VLGEHLGLVIEDDAAVLEQQPVEALAVAGVIAKGGRCRGIRASAAGGFSNGSKNQWGRKGRRGDAALPNARAVICRAESRP
jgi:hypothetical protein